MPRKPHMQRDLSHSSLCSARDLMGASSGVLPRPPEDIPASIYSLKSADHSGLGESLPGGGPMDLNIGYFIFFNK